MAGNDIHTVYLGGYVDWKPPVLKSVDGGQTWQPVFLVEGNQNIATGWLGDGGDVNWYWTGNVLGLTTAPNDSERLTVTDLGFVHMSDDGGLAWRQAYVEPVPRGVHFPDLKSPIPPSTPVPTI